MNKYTKRAEQYLELQEEITKAECKLTICLKEFGGGNNRLDCDRDGRHIFCYCDNCTKHPTCRRCRLFIQTGKYL